MGAMDYITKPFDIDELVLRIRNIVRRKSVVAESEPATDSIEIGNITLNKETLSLSVDGRVKTTVTLREAELLAYLYSHRNTIVKREELLIRFWGENDSFMGRSLDVLLSSHPKLLRPTVAGVRSEERH